IKNASDLDDKYKARLRLGYLYMKQGKIEEGLPLLKSVIAKNADSHDSESMQLFLASELLNQGRTQDSINEYQHYLETYTNAAGKATAYQGKGWGLIAVERYAEAAGSFLKSYEMFDNDQDKARSLYKAGDAYFSNKQFLLAKEAYTRLLTEFPDTKLRAEVVFQLGECSMQLKEHKKAEEHFRSIISKFANNPTAEEALLKLAAVKAEQKDWKSAINIFDELMVKYPKSSFYADALYGKAMANYRIFSFSASLESLDKILSDFPNSGFVEQSYFQRGMCWYWLGQDNDALATYNSFLKKYPESNFVPDVLFWLGKYYYNHGDFLQAEKRMVSFADKYKDLSLADDSLYWAALSATKRKEYLLSIELLNRLLKDYPKSDKTALARFAQADALSMIDKSSAAILVFDEIINKYPGSGLVAAAWGRKGDCQFTLGSDDAKRYEESIDSYKIVVGDADASLDLVLQAEYKTGRSYEKLGEIDKAFEYYYNKVILRYFSDKEKGITHNEASKVWFTIAAFNAADILESKKELRRVVAILNRIIDAKVGSDELAQERIKKIRSEQWRLF
ncbi:MAG: tetratricopeptide repeat protein, partial [Kiritimatiellae bacterium]|nr:tetratricopeptide repeat protein [Kiritimatiellia bacterium]